MLLTVDFKTKNDVNSTSLCKFIVEQGILRALTNNTTLFDWNLGPLRDGRMIWLSTVEMWTDQDALMENH